MLEYALIINLYNAAVDHKKHCGENCSVSLTQMREAAAYIWRVRLGSVFTALPSNEQLAHVDQMFKEWPH